MTGLEQAATRPLPPGLSEAEFARAIDGFAAALGSDRVLTGDEDLLEFRDPFAHATWDDDTASAVVMPTTVEEVQAVVGVANEHRIPLWTHGTGRNNGYGGPAPRVRGSVIVSLREMNRVLEIDEECAYAVVEPGVRWFDLYEAIQAVRMVPQVINTVLMSSVLSSREQWWQGEGPIPDDVIDTMARELDVGRWIVRFALYGDEAVVDHRFAKIKAAFGRIPGADLRGTKYPPEDIPGIPDPGERVQGGVPNLDLNAMTGWYGGEKGGHIGFSPVARLTGSDGRALTELLRGMVNEAGLDYMAALIASNARSFINVVLIIFDTENEPQSRAAYDVAKRLVREAAKIGYGEYRAHLDFMDLASEQYSFNDHAYRRFTETIKDALDPNAILSPGKQGIWPRAMRDGRG